MGPECGVRVTKHLMSVTIMAAAVSRVEGRDHLFRNNLPDPFVALLLRTIISA